MAKESTSRFGGTAKRFMLAAILLLLSVGAMFAFSQWSSALFPAYRHISQMVLGALSVLTGFVSVAVWDIALLAVVAVFLAALVVCVVRRKGFLAWLSWLALIASAFFTLMVFFWGLNHYAPSLSSELNLEVGEYSAEELEDATKAYLDEAASLAALVPRNEDGSLETQDFEELAAIAGSSYASLSSSYSVFKTSGQPVKKLSALGTFLLYTGHNGIFCPITGESSVPEDCGVADEPFVMSHEVAHRCGIASEQEANFAAFLACSTNSDPRFQYSANFQAFRYCLSALAANYPSRAKDLIVSSAGESYSLVYKDYNATVEHYRQFSGPLEKVGTAANDAYLKTFNEPEGVMSYGMVVDYLIAWRSK